MDHGETADNRTGAMLPRLLTQLGETAPTCRSSGDSPERRTSFGEASSLSSDTGRGQALSGTGHSVRAQDGIRSSFICVPLAGRRVHAWRPALPHFGTMGWLLI